MPMSLAATELPVTVVPAAAALSSIPVAWESVSGSGPQRGALHSLTSSTSSTTPAPTTTSTSSTNTTSSTSTSFTTTTTSVTSSTTLPPATVCGHPYQPGGGLSVGWDTYAGIPCVTGNDSTGYVVVDGHVYAG